MEKEDNSENMKPKNDSNKLKNILANLDIIKISDSDKDVTSFVEVKVVRRDINQKLVKIPEFSEEEFESIIKERGYEYNGFEGSMSFVLKKGISNENNYEEESKIEKLRETVKEAQLEYIEKEKHNIDVRSEIIDILSSTISRANRKFKIDRNKAFLIFKNMLGSLVERREDNLIFMDDQEIDRIVDAALADTPENVKENLEVLFKTVIVKIRKLFLIFAYEQLSTKIINYHLEEGELSKLQENKYISIEGAKLRVFSFNAYGKKCFVAVDIQFGDIVTFGLGKKMRTELDPIIHSIFIDRISFHVQREFLTIMSMSMERVKIELLSNLSKGMYLDFEHYSTKELIQEREEINNLSEILYRQTINIIHKVEASNKDYLQTILKKKIRYLSRVFGGAINQDIYAILPLDMIESSKNSLIKIGESNQIFFDFMKDIENNYKKAIEAKQEGKLEIVKKIASNIKEKAFGYITNPENLLKMGKFILEKIGFGSK